jgi:hypothetical protein
MPNRKRLLLVAGGVGKWPGTSRVATCQNRRMLSIGTIVMGAADEGRAADFWTQALDYVPRDALVEDDWVVLVSGLTDGSSTSLGPAIHSSVFRI